MAAKIVFIGSGSTIFAKNLMVDILFSPMLQNVHIVLYDIDTIRLHTSKIVGEKIIAQTKSSATLEATQDITYALSDAHYVITMF